MNEKSEDMLKLKVDGKEVEVPRGATILEAADRAGIHIPTLCHDPRLKPFGACRLCVVEIEGRGTRLVTACTTPAEKGISVISYNPRIEKVRRTILELLAVHHPVDCPVCDKAGECKLQELTVELRHSDKRRFEGFEKKKARDRRNPLVERDMARCVACGKCVRVCAEVQGTCAIDFQYRGFVTSIGPQFNEPLDCDFCGQCIDICPVGALMNKQYKFTTRSWLLKKYPAVCSFCGDGCVVEIGVGQKGTIVRGRGVEGIGLNGGNLCQRGRFGHDYLLSSNRVGEPMVRKEGELTAVGWKEAVSTVADRLKEIKSKHGSDSIAFMVGGRIDNEGLYALSRFMNDVVESGKVSSSSMRKYKNWIGVVRDVWNMKPPVVNAASALDSDLILVLESEINATNPLVWVNIHQAMMKKEASVVVADSRRSKAGWRASKFLKVDPGGAVELLLRIASVILKRGLFDTKSAGKISGFERFAKEANSARPVLTDDVSDMDVALLATEIVKAKNPLLVITLDASENMKSKQLLSAAANLAVLLGRGPDSILVPMPESNMRGLTESGMFKGAGSEDPSIVVRNILNGKIRALYITGDDPISHLPEMNNVRKAFLSLDMLVVQDIMVSPTAAMADVILPAAAWAEHEGSYTSSNGLIQAFGKIVTVPGRAKPDWEIISMVSEEMGRAMGYGSVEGIRKDYIEQWHPGKKILTPGVSSYMEVVGEPGGKPAGRFLEVGYTIRPPSLGRKELLLVTGPMRGHSGILSTYSAAITSVFSEPLAMIHPGDAEEMGVKDGDSVNVRSASGEISIKVRLDEEVKRGVIFISVHFSEPPVLDLFTSDSYVHGMPVKVKITPLSIPHPVEASPAVH